MRNSTRPGSIFYKTKRIVKLLLNQLQRGKLYILIQREMIYSLDLLFYVFFSLNF